MEEKPSYYSIIPANVRYDTELTPNAKLLYAEITALCNEKGYCWATNEYFANLYSVSKTSISKWISNLIQKGYIYSEMIYKEGTKEILNRYLSIVKEPIEEKLNTPIEEKLKDIEDNNTSINNTNNKKEIYKERFKKPTLEEVKEYCKQRNSSVNPNVFYEYFETGNWVDSKGNKVKNWKQKIITWEKQQPKQKTTNEEIIPDWFNKDLNKKEEKKESDLTDEQKDRIKRLLANSGK